MRNSIQKVDFTLADTPFLFVLFLNQSACRYHMLGRIQIKVFDRWDYSSDDYNVAKEKHDKT